jgi:hypothetical protein
MTSIATVVASLLQSTSSQRELALAIHNHVRDEIAFGFTRRHDKADAPCNVMSGIARSESQSLLQSAPRSWLS